MYLVFCTLELSVLQFGNAHRVIFPSSAVLSPALLSPKVRFGKASGLMEGAFASCAVCNTVDAADWIFCLDTKQVRVGNLGG